MKAASHGAVHDAGQPHVDRTGCHARRPLGGITGAGRRGGSSAAGFRWPSLAFRSQIYYFRSSRESEASTCTLFIIEICGDHINYQNLLTPILPMLLNL